MGAMDNDDIIGWLKDHPNRAELARETGLRYGYLCKLVWGEIKNPGSQQIDTLREYRAKQIESRPQ